MTNTSGCVLMLPQRVWIGSPPLEMESFPDLIEAFRSGQFGRAALEEEVFSTSSASGISISAQRQGLLRFAFPASHPGAENPDASSLFDERIRALSERVKVINAYLLCLHSALLQLQRRSTQLVLPSLHDLISIDDDGKSMGGMRIIDLLPEVGGVDYWMRPVVVPLEAMEMAARHLDEALSHESERALDLVVLLSAAVSSYQQHNYALALVAAWTVSEVLLNLTWTAYIEAQSSVGSPLSSDRKRVIQGRDFTALVLTEILSLANRIGFELYERLMASRKARNRWLHDMTPPSRDGVAEAIMTARDFLEQALRLDIKVSLGLTI